MELGEDVFSGDLKMQAGVITVGGSVVGYIEVKLSDETSFVPDVAGYEPSGRAGDEQGQEETDRGDQDHGAAQGHGHHDSPERGPLPSPSGHDQPQQADAMGSPVTSRAAGGAPFRQGSAETMGAIERAAKSQGLDPDMMKSVASIESSMNPSSNADKKTQYKGLYQMGSNEWERFGEGNVYSAEDNAMGAARMFKENRDQFKSKMGRDPTDTEMYLMHQQGLGFYTRGAMTNIGGNPYPGMSGPQTRESFESGWGKELARRKEIFKSGGESAAPSASGRSGANYMSGAALPYSEHTSVKTAGGNTFTASPESAPYLKGFVEDLEKAGAPIRNIGGHNIRNIAGSNRLSQHAYGNAIDINQQSRDVVDKPFREWSNQNPDVLRAAQNKWGVISGGDWKNPDFGHFEWSGRGAAPTKKMSAMPEDI